MHGDLPARCDKRLKHCRKPSTKDGVMSPGEIGVGKAHPIEEESMGILSKRVDLSTFPAAVAQVVARVIHATADLDYATSIVIDEKSVDAGIAAIASGAPVICDVEMVRAGLSVPGALCCISQLSPSPTGWPTRSALAIRLAASRHPRGAIFVIGCAPTALDELTRQITEGLTVPSLVIGMPVGFVGAAQSKEKARQLSEIPTITNIGEKGGSAPAAATLNAIYKLWLAKQHGPLELPAP